MRSDAASTHTLVVGMAFLTGGVVGAAAALLFTPAEGRETREQIRGYLGGAWDRTRDRIGTVANTVANQGRGFVSDTVAPLNAAYRAGRDAYRSETTRLRRLVRADAAAGGEKAESRQPM